MTREGHHGQVGGGLPATLAVTRVIFLGAPRPVVGHRRHFPPWPSIISYPGNVITVIIAQTETQRKLLMDIVVQESENKGFYLNITRSFIMVFSKYTNLPDCNIRVQGKRFDKVNRFIYLWSLSASDERCEQDIRRRIGIAKSIFTSIEKILKARDIDPQLRIRVLKCYVWATLLYGCETWTLSCDMMKQLEAVEMWFRRRMLRI